MDKTNQIMFIEDSPMGSLKSYGTFTQSGDHTIKFYGYRKIDTNKPQVLVAHLGSYIWINIEEHWID